MRSADRIVSSPNDWNFRLDENNPFAPMHEQSTGEMPARWQGRVARHLNEARRACGTKVFGIHTALPQPAPGGVMGERIGELIQFRREEFLGQTRCRSIKRVVQPGAGASQSDQRRTEFRMGFDRTSKSIAQIARRMIAGIFPPCNLTLRQPLTEHTARDGKQGMQHQKFAELHARLNAPKARSAAAAQQALQNRLRLIVSVMSEDDTLKMFFPDDVSEHLKSRRPIARGRIVRHPGKPGCDVTQTLDDAGNAARCGKLPDKFGVRLTVAPARFVVQVGDMEPYPGNIVQ